MKMQRSVCPLWRTVDRKRCLCLLFALFAVGQRALVKAPLE
jgi:hypothetical protein